MIFMIEKISLYSFRCFDNSEKSVVSGNFKESRGFSWHFVIF